jgi:hypothetical protein
MSKIVTVDSSFNSSKMKKITKSSLTRLRKEALIELALKFGWSESHSSKPLKKTIKEDFIEYILEMAELFKDDLTPISLLSSQNEPDKVVEESPEKTCEFVVEEATAKEPSPIAASSPISKASPAIKDSSPIANYSLMAINESTKESFPPIVESYSKVSPIAKASPMAIKESTKESSPIFKQDSPTFQETLQITESVLSHSSKKRKLENLVTDEMEKLSITDSVPTGLNEKFSNLNLGAIPKKRPPPLKIPLVQSLKLERNMTFDGAEFPQLVESVVPSKSSIFHFPEKSDISSENGIRLRNAKELADVLAEIKETNHPDLSTLNDIDALLSRAFGVVS